MSADSHLWAITYDDVTQADKVREQISNLAWGSGHAGKYLILLDIVCVVRHPDGSFTFDRNRSRRGMLCVAARAFRGLAHYRPHRALGGTALPPLREGGISPDFVKVRSPDEARTSAFRAGRPGGSRDDPRPSKQAERSSKPT